MSLVFDKPPMFSPIHQSKNHQMTLPGILLEALDIERRDGDDSQHAEDTQLAADVEASIQRCLDFARWIDSMPFPTLEEGL